MESLAGDSKAAWAKLLELAQRNVAEGEQNIARQREIIAGLEGSGPESGALQTARELLRQIARYWQMRVEEIQTFVGLARSVNDVEATEIVLRIAGDYQRLVQRAAGVERPS